MNCYIIERKTKTYKLIYEQGSLRKVEGIPGFDPSFFRWLVDHGMDIEANIKDYKSDFIKVEPMIVNFEDFWNLYDYKKDRQNAVKQWDKLSEESKLMAYKGVKKFMRGYGGQGQPPNPPYADRYLKNKRWEDEE